jgi:hypothetical protein
LSSVLLASQKRLVHPIISLFEESEELKMDESVGRSSGVTQPVIIDLGRQKPKALKDLKKGEGKLWGEVLDIIEEVEDQLGEQADGKVFVPVVLIYQKKFRRQRLDKLLFPYFRR